MVRPYPVVTGSPNGLATVSTSGRGVMNLKHSIATRRAARSSDRRGSRLARTGLAVLAGALVVAGLVLPTSPAFAATKTVGQCNNIGPSPAGATTGMTCTVTVVNTISGSTTSSTTTVTRQCSLGPCPPGNGTFTTHSTNLVTSVNQCNGSDNDAAHPINCRVTITNNISANAPNAKPLATATSNQCVGSGTGGGGTVNCLPFPATTTSATVTQCNGSGNGGGGTVHCTVSSGSTISRAIPIKVNQCNGTGNPGGSVVTCQTSITTHITSAAGGTQVTRVPTGGVQTGDGSTAGLREAWLLTLGGVLLLAAALGVAFRRRLVNAAPHVRR